jgi:hypothetical protein
MDNPIFISFYTLQGNYPKLAKKLISSLDKFDLEHEIVKVKSFSSWGDGVAFKPRFMLEKLLSHRRSIVWLDIDTEVWRFAIYNWQADNNHHLDNKINYDPNTKTATISGGVQKYGYTAPAIEVLIRWISTLDAVDHSKGGDPWLDSVLNTSRPPVNALWLPKEYNRMDKLSRHWAEIPAEKVVINHDYKSGQGGRHRNV